MSHLSVQKLFSIFLICCACAPERAEPVGDNVLVVLGNGPTAFADADLRAALVWTLGVPTERIVVSQDQQVPSDGEFQLHLELPAPNDLAQAQPVVGLTLPVQAVPKAVVPRIVVYADLNENKHLDFSSPVLTDAGTGASQDPIVAINRLTGSLPVALLDLKKQLRSFTLDETQLYYKATLGRFTPFVGRAPDATLVSLAEAPVVLALQPPELSATQLWCRSSDVVQQASVPNVRAIVASELDAVAVCGVQLLACESHDLSAMSPPIMYSSEDGAISRVAQCRRNDALEVLVVQENLIECLGCHCFLEQDITAVVARRHAAPEWWPCGDEVLRCESRRPLTDFNFDTQCGVRADAGVAADGGVVMDADRSLADSSAPDSSSSRVP